MARKNDFELMLIRHGEAEMWADGGDSARELTQAGRQALERCVPTYNLFDWGWSKALVSPYLRARQTAGVFHQGLGEMFERTYGEPLPLPVEEGRLTPENAPEVTARLAIEHGQTLAGPRPRIALFGHNPNLSAVASLLLFGPSVRGQISLGCGDMVHLFIPAPSPFDSVLAPVNQEPLPHAVLLGYYPRAVLER